MCEWMARDATHLQTEEYVEVDSLGKKQFGNKVGWVEICRGGSRVDKGVRREVSDGERAIKSD